MPWRVNADDVIHSLLFRSEEREESPINMPEATAASPPPPESILSDQIPHPDNDAITATNDAIDNNNEKALLQQQQQQDSMVVVGSEAAYEITQDQLQDLLNQGILSSVPESAVATVTAAATAAADVMQECEDEIEAEAIEPPHEANNQPQAETASPRRYSRRACRRSGPNNATVFEVHVNIFSHQRQPLKCCR